MCILSPPPPSLILLLVNMWTDDLLHVSFCNPKHCSYHKTKIFFEKLNIVRCLRRSGIPSVDKYKQVTSNICDMSIPNNNIMEFLIPNSFFFETTIFLQLKDMFTLLVTDERLNDDHLYTPEEFDDLLRNAASYSEALESCGKNPKFLNPEFVHAVTFIPKKYRITKPFIQKKKEEVEKATFLFSNIQRDVFIHTNWRETSWGPKCIPYDKKIEKERGSAVFEVYILDDFHLCTKKDNQNDCTLQNMAIYEFVKEYLFDKNYSWLEMYDKVWDTPLPPLMQRAICTALFKPLKILCMSDPTIVAFSVFSHFWDRVDGSSPLYGSNAERHPFSGRSLVDDFKNLKTCVMKVILSKYDM